jgi:hypothetical protein
MLYGFKAMGACYNSIEMILQFLSVSTSTSTDIAVFPTATPKVFKLVR